MNWYESSETMREHSLHLKAAILFYQREFPERTLDLTKAVKEYAIFLGLPENYFMLSSNMGLKLSNLQEAATAITCPKCGAPLGFEQILGCVAVRFKVPFTGLIYCTNDECLYHFYTLESHIDVYKKLKEQMLGMLKKFEGVI